MTASAAAAERQLYAPNQPWNPAERLEQMRENYDRLVHELGVSPRGSVRRSGNAVHLPRVPQSRHWQGGASGSQSARKAPTDAGALEPRKVGYGKKAKKAGADGVQTARLTMRLDAMAESGQLSATQAKRLRKLWALQEQIAAAAMEGGDQDALLESFNKVLAYIEEPDATIVPSIDFPESTSSAPPHAAPAAVEPAAAVEASADPTPPPSAPLVPQPPPPRSAGSAKGSGKGSSGPTPPGTGGSAAGGAPAGDPEADAAFAKIDTFLHKGAARVSELFRRMDSNLDGEISPAELLAGLTALECVITHDEVIAFLRKVDPHGKAGRTTLKQLARALRPGQSVKSLLKQPEAKEGDAPISPQDMLPDGLTEEEAAQMRAEAHLRAGRLPSLSPDEEDGESPRAKKGSVSLGTEYVWNQLEARIAPDGVQVCGPPPLPPPLLTAPRP